MTNKEREIIKNEVEGEMAYLKDVIEDRLEDIIDRKFPDVGFRKKLTMLSEALRVWRIAYDDGTYSELDYFAKHYKTMKLALKDIKCYLKEEPQEKPYLFVYKEK